MARESAQEIRVGLEQAVKQANALLTVLDKVTAEIVASGKEAQKSFKNLDLASTKDIAKLNQQLKQSEELSKKKVQTDKEVVRVQKEKLALDKQLKVATDEEVKGKLRLQEVRKNQRNILRDELILLNKESGTLQKLAAQNRQLRREREKVNAETKIGALRITALNKQLDSNNAKIDKNSDKLKKQKINIGNYGSALGGLRANLISVASAAGVTLGLFGAFRVLRSSISLVRDFEKANATLAGVLNQTKDETKELADDSIRLGSITVKTATEITALQTAYARLGFAQSEILKLTEGTINGSIALNASLDETAELVGAVVNSYDDLSAADTERILETLTAGTTATALTFDKLQTSLPIVLGAANALDVGLAEVTATLGSLANGGIEASTAATSLRNIFIESAKEGIDYKKALEEITNSSDKLTTANEIFGKRAAVSALVIANNTENVAALTVELENAEVVMQLVDNELNTLDGSLQLLNSAWEGYILNLNDATEGGNILSTSIRFVGENLSTIINLIGIATTAFVTFKLAVQAANLASKAGIVINNTATVATNLRTIATRAATVAQQAFNKASKANVIGVIIALLAAAATAWYAFRDGANEATTAQKRFNDEKQKSLEATSAQIKIEDTIHNKTIQDIKDEIELRKIQGEDAKKLDQEFNERATEVIDDRIKRNQEFIESEKAKSEQLKKELDIRVKDIESQTKEISTLDREFTVLQKNKFNEGLENQKKEEIRIYNDANAEITGGIEERNKLIAKLNAEALEINKKQIKDVTELTKAEIAAGIKRAKELEVLKQRLQDVRISQILDDEARELEEVRVKFNRQIEAIKGNSDIEIALRKELEEKKQAELTKVRAKFLDPIDEEPGPKKKGTPEGGGLADIIKNENDILKDELQERKEMFDESITFIEDRFDRLFEKRQEQIEKDLADNLDVQARIQRGIEAGNLDAQKSLAAEERREAELEQKKDAARKKAQRAEAFIAALKLLGENADQPNALGKTLSDTSAILAFAQSLPTFFSGTDDTGTVANGLDSNGGRLSVLHDNEQVWSQSDRADVGNRTREQIKDIVSSHERNLITDSRTGLLAVDNGGLILEVKKMQKSLDTLHERMPVSSYEHDEMSKQNITTVKYHNKIEKLRKRAKQSWS